MRDFFKPWRRKIGVVALVMACVVMAGWVRSHAKTDLLFLPAVFILSSNDGAFAISQEVQLKSDLENGGHVKVTFDSKSFLSQTKWSSSDRGTTRIIQPRMIPYSAVVIPLTLLSAYLLLVKPRSRAPKTIDPAPATGP